MIPLQLGLRNFMSYGEGPNLLDFSGWQIACLSGANGHGKSALFDAMTWALWGRCRAKREDDVVRQGATNAEVDFEFGVGGGEYRVVRKRTVRRSTGQTTLELHVRHDGEWKTATGASVAETQATLVGILKLSYETFINSAFLMQGRADEFTTKAPNERKKVLGEILSLGRYDDLAERARVLARERESEVDAARLRLDELDREIGTRPGLEEQERQAERQVAQADLEVLEQSNLLSRLQERRQEQQRVAADLNERQARQKELLDLIAHDRKRCTTLEEFIARCEALIARRDEITRDYGELQAARTALEELAQAGRQAHDLEKRIFALERAISAKEEQVRARARQERAVATAERGVAVRVPALANSIGEVTIQVAGLPRVENDLAELRARRDTIKADLATFAAENTGLTKQRTVLRDRLIMLKGAGALCPICRTPLDPEGQQRVQEEYIAEGTAIKARQEEIEQRRRTLEDEVGRGDGQEPRLLGILRDLQQAAGRLESLRTQLRDAREAEARAAEAEHRAEAIEATLGSPLIAPQEREELARLQHELAMLGYDKGSYDQAQQRVAALQERQTPYEQLQRAITELVPRQEQCADLRANLIRYELEDRKVGAEVAALQERFLDRAALDGEIIAATAVRTTMEARRRQLQQTLGDLHGALRRLEMLTDERARLAEHHIAVEREQSVYRDLGHAFGRQGIQAMLIDAALPEIENVANEILARMTDNSVHVQFSTQRTGATGNVVETLDIRIADSAGTRSYEMFSGGEAFRVNFAIRVALSRLLAGRAGASLQTLIIDEGFGSQDGAGRERLIDAITSIAAEFQKILVITHLEELKDFFPVHIEVLKGPSGSQVLIAE